MLNLRVISGPFRDRSTALHLLILVAVLLEQWQLVCSVALLFKLKSFE